ncbi:hypothetical protein SAMN04487944_13221 [Gracilibacillus ureilyticus]|uniref:Uncharacterized protein n=1 Tax=Gracilibacillus ureilyticus TaxID=531814 RepID=A0A1H9W236_9BACI|nr:hypothetical protein SAMN04487944_13221 [Gracilibacillus ureilyticus]
MEFKHAELTEVGIKSLLIWRFFSSPIQSLKPHSHTEAALALKKGEILIAYHSISIVSESAVF